MKILNGFSVDSHDKEGDVCEEGIYLHFGECRIRVAESLTEYHEFIKDLQNMSEEIEEAISERNN